jgi:hypothetical protein
LLCALTGLSCGDTPGPDNGRVKCDNTAVLVHSRTAAVLEASVDDSTAPILDQLTIAPCLVDLSSGEVTVAFTLNGRDLQAGISRVVLQGTTPAGVRPECRVASPASGTSHDGNWRCSWVLNRYAEPGVWAVRAAIFDSAGNQDSAVASLTVVNALSDTVPPVLTGIVYPEERTTLGFGEARTLVVSGSDGESGMWRVEIFGVQEDPLYDWSCNSEAGVWPPGPPPSPEAWRPLSDYSPGCPIPLQESSTPVVWTIREVRLIDLRNNRRVYGESELRQAGFVTQIDVSKGP